MQMSNMALIAVGILCLVLAVSGIAKIVNIKKSGEKVASSEYIYPVLKCALILAFAIYLLVTK